MSSARRESARASLSGAASTLLISALALGGCAHQAGSLAGAMAEEVPEPLINESLRTLADEDTQHLIGQVLGMPEIQGATRDLISNVTDGALDALSDEERAARLAELSSAFVTQVSMTLADVLEREVAPAMMRTMSRALDASLNRILSDETTDRMAAAVANLATESTAALAIAVREELAPAMRAALEDPAVQEMIAGTTRTMSRGMVLGVQDAFEEIEARRGPEQTNTILTRLQQAAGPGYDILQVALVALLIGLLVLLGLLLRAIARSREHAAEAHRREAAILALTEALKSTEDRPWSRELLELLKESFRDNEHAVYLRDVLRRNRHLRMGRRGGPDDREEPGGGGPGTFEPAT